MKGRVRLSTEEARRIALAAQGMHRDRPECAPDARHFRQALRALRVLQLDFVNVLVPAHNLILWLTIGSASSASFTDAAIIRNNGRTKRRSFPATRGRCWRIDAPLTNRRRTTHCTGSGIGNATWMPYCSRCKGMAR
jgi:hypothetical protein